MSVNNRSRHSKRSRRDFQIELEQAESLFVAPVSSEEDVIFMNDDFLEDGSRSQIGTGEWNESMRFGQAILSSIMAEAVKRGAHPVPFVRTAHFR